MFLTALRGLVSLNTGTFWRFLLIVGIGGDSFLESFVFYWPQGRKEAGFAASFTVWVAVPRFYPFKIHVISSYALQEREEIAVHLSSRFIFLSCFILTQF